MKTKIVLALALGLASTAHAVQIKNCPDSLDLKVQKVTMLTEGEVFKHAEFSFSGEEKATFADHLKEIRSNQAALDKVPQSVHMPLRSKLNGTCNYKAGRIEAVIYTKNGKDLMLVSLTNAVTAYISVKSISTDSIQLGRQDKRPLNSEYGDINEEGNAGDFFRAILAFADLDVR